MLTKQDLTDALKTTEERLTTKIEASRKEFNEEIEIAVGQISKAVVKALENTATKDDIANMATKEDLAELKQELKEDIGDLKTEVIFLKNEVQNLNADTPTAKEFQNHEKRITRLEKTALSV